VFTYNFNNIQINYILVKVAFIYYILYIIYYSIYILVKVDTDSIFLTIKEFNMRTRNLPCDYCEKGLTVRNNWKDPNNPVNLYYFKNL
jgi:hypothetical protein